MGYQFIHIEGYARQAGKSKAGGNDIRSVSAEADRIENNCPHVEKPAAPKILYGVSASKVAKMAEEWAENSVDSRGHKLRKDGLCLLSGVISAPDDLQDWGAFKKASYLWLKEQWGDRLKSIIEHTDESHRHIHFYAVPKPGEKFDDIHQGKKAAALVKKQPKGVQNQAYIDAMRAFQDDFSERVGMKAGLTKLGPGRRRLTREEWQAEQRQAKFFASAKAQHKAARKKGYREGLQAGQEEATQQLETIGTRAGTVLAAAGKAVFSAWHKPSKEAELQREKAEKKADEEAAARRSIEVTFQAKLDRQAKLHQAEVDRLQRIAQNAETDLHRLETKFAELAPADPNTKHLKKRTLDN